MKQNISVDDLMELSEQQKEKLRGMWEPKEYAPVYYAKDKVEFHYLDESFVPTKNELLPLLSIGDMIEILEQKGEVYSVNNMYVNIGTNKKGWGILLLSQNKEYRSDDLVTALWQAVKSIL